MSGTSLDGVDAMLAGFGSARPEPLAHSYVAFPEPFKLQLGELCVSGPDEFDRAGVAQQQLARHYAQAVDQLLARAQISSQDVRAIGAHGQTIRHRPEQGYTLQLNAPALLAELCGIDVVSDFRSRDIAAGGQGAPLAPVYHQALAGRLAKPVAVLNLGGVGNVTWIGEHELIAFDTGPGNGLIDDWVRARAGHPYDEDGRIAAAARID